MGQRLVQFLGLLRDSFFWTISCTILWTFLRDEDKFGNKIEDKFGDILQGHFQVQSRVNFWDNFNLIFSPITVKDMQRT